MDGKRTESCTGLGRVVPCFGCEEHAAACACKRRQARPVDLGSDPKARHSDLLGPHQVDEPRKVAGVDTVESGAVADVDDRAGALRAIELADSFLQHRHDVGRSEGRAGIESKPSLLQRGGVGGVKSIGQRLAGHIHGGDREPVAGPCGSQETVDGTQGPFPVASGLACRRVDEHEHIDRFGRRGLCGPQPHGSDFRLDRGCREALDKRDRGCRGGEGFGRHDPRGGESTRNRKRGQPGAGHSGRSGGSGIGFQHETSWEA